MVATHHNKKFFSCNECGQDFVSKWRLNKHMTIHQDMPKRKCHYFNNGMICLFIEHGCKFLHVESEECRFGKHCKRTKCQYRH